MLELCRWRVRGFAAALLVAGQPAWADAGVPMLFLTLPAMLIALVPIVAIEALVIVRGLSIAVRKGIIVTAASNVASTLLGIPITWVALVAIEIGTGGGRAYGLNTPLQKFMAVTWQAPWLIPYEEDLYWMVPTATLVLMVPFFFASWLTEYYVARWMLNSIDPVLLRRTVRNANIMSYAVLALVALTWLFTAKPAN